MAVSVHVVGYSLKCGLLFLKRDQSVKLTSK